MFRIVGSVIKGLWLCCGDRKGMCQNSSNYEIKNDDISFLSPSDKGSKDTKWVDGGSLGIMSIQSL